MHLGHQCVYEEMVAHCDQSITFIGSANAKWSVPLFFNYRERREFFITLFPEARILPLPDFAWSNELWLYTIRSMLTTIGFPPEETVFFGGCNEDVMVLAEEGRFKTHILNRFDGSTPKTSATAVRDALLNGRSLDGMVDPLIQKLIQDIWDKKWKKFLKYRS